MISAIVLAAGTSSRFGSQKLVAPLAGKPVVRWTVERVLASRVSDVIVVIGREGDAVRHALSELDVRFVTNARYVEGMSTSLVAALAALQPHTRAVIVALGDQPSVTPGIIDGLIAEYERAGAPIVVPSYAGDRGNPVLFDASILPELRAVTGDQGAREVVARERSRVATVNLPFAMPRDVDSTDDLLALERREIARAIELSEAIAWEDMTAAAPPSVAAACGARALRVGGAVAALAPGIDVLSFNRVMAIGIDEPATGPMIDELVELYRSTGVRRFFVQPSPESQPPALMDWLRARGFGHYNSWAKLFRRAQPVRDVPNSPTLPHVERIGAERAALFGEIVATGFGMPESVRPWLAGTVGREGWTHYLASDGDAPVAGAALFVHQGVGWLGIASTLPTHRGRGAQSALIARRVRDAIEAGCSLMAVETAEDRSERPSPSFRNVMRFGFEVAYLRPNFLLEL